MSDCFMKLYLCEIRTSGLRLQQFAIFFTGSVSPIIGVFCLCLAEILFGLYIKHIRESQKGLQSSGNLQRVRRHSQVHLVYSA